MPHSAKVYSTQFANKWGLQNILEIGDTVARYFMATWSRDICFCPQRSFPLIFCQAYDLPLP